MTDNKEREAFESLYAKHYPIGRDDEGYFDSDVGVAWLAWQRRAALALASAQGEQSAPTPAAADRYVKCIECCKNFVRSDLDLICRPCRDGQAMPGAQEGA